MRLTEHEDGKPIMVDFRSPLLLENLAAVARSYHRLRFTEMLPARDDYWLADTRGRHAFEVRLVTRAPVR